MKRGVVGTTGLGWSNGKAVGAHERQDGWQGKVVGDNEKETASANNPRHTRVLQPCQLFRRHAHKGSNEM